MKRGLGVLGLLLGLTIAAACAEDSANHGEPPPELTEDAHPPPLLADDAAGAFGPPLGVKVDLVRSFEMTTTGAFAAKFAGTRGDGTTGFRGICDPESFANFTIEFPTGDEFRRASILVQSEGPLGTGETGEFPLSSLEVSLIDRQYAIQEFHGPAMLTLSAHDAGLGNRRMAGTIRGEGLHGQEEAAGQTLDAEAHFDLEFSCGVH